MEAEFLLTSFARDMGVRFVPRPISCDFLNHVALYEFVSGRPVQRREVTRDAIHKAIRFYEELNRGKDSPRADGLPYASEACFSIEDHIQTVTHRVEKLLRISSRTAIDCKARLFVEKKLAPAWRETMDTVLQKAGRHSLNMSEAAPQKDWNISPSDFGFHNAIRQTNGDIWFVDFEYAGWDAPDKLVCDFFCQPAVPVPMEFFQLFAVAVISSTSSPERYRTRVEMLMPLYQIKWCCIMLNEFLPIGSRRREFSGSDRNSDEMKARQLEKACRALNDAPVRNERFEMIISDL